MTDTQDNQPGGGLAALAVAAAGIVYGDVGTSPLYTIRECFHGDHPVPVTPVDVFGVISLIFWAITVVISVKYVLFVMRADNRGEGGVLALMAMAQQSERRARALFTPIILMGLVGAALFYGDSTITPAISVLSAVEGLEVAAPHLAHFIVPLSIVVLLVLFLFQRQGTGGIGALFGPVMVLWFIVLAVMGIREIIVEPRILEAVDPRHALTFILAARWHAFLVLGAVVLAVTGAEALYADMGHFGPRPIRLAWYFLVMPALLLNYFGQGALLLHHPQAAFNPFYHMAPAWALYPLIGLATIATVIASQAVISGTFSLTHQAVALGFLPRMAVRHTSQQHFGQIYMPEVNWLLMAAVVALTVGFGSSSSLAAAYGIAVTGTMLLTTLMGLVVARRLWHWPLGVVVVLGLVLLTVDFLLFSSTAIKLLEGGWFPVLVGLCGIILMTTWRQGRRIVRQRMSRDMFTAEQFLERVTDTHPQRVAGTAVFLTSNPEVVPPALLHNLKHNKVLHERVCLVTVVTTPVPRLTEDERYEVVDLGKNFWRITLHYGFGEEPNVPKALGRLKRFGLDFDFMSTSFFISRETLIPSKLPGMALWREGLFAILARNATSPTEFFHIPANRVIELGTQVQL